MIAKIRRGVGDAYAPVVVALALPDRGRRLSEFVGNVDPRTVQLILRARRAWQQLKGIAGGDPASDRFMQLRAFVIEMNPIAQVHLGMQMDAPEITEIGLKRDRLVEARHRLFEAPSKMSVVPRL